MSNEELKLALDDSQALAITMDAEGRGDWREGNSSLEERVAVGCVIRNRARDGRRWPDTIRGVCLQRGQFSCWLQGGGLENYRRTIALARFFVEKAPFPVLSQLEVDLFMETAWIVDGILGGQLLDRTGGSNHYYAPAGMKPIGRVPDWAIGKTPKARIGSQFFYRL